MQDKLSAAVFAAFLMERAAKKDGYIMGATGQNPKKWAASSWWFTQYKDTTQRRKAIYWRNNAERVFDCQGLVEGYINDQRGTNINVCARTNYANWCDPKGSGKIPEQYKVQGAAVFYHNGKRISHVGYLVEPVKAGNPAGDWWVVEAKGVMYGVVQTKLSAGKWNRWGLMTKYFDYGSEQDEIEFGERTLSKGCVGDDVKELQSILIELGYSCGVWGADGDFGMATRDALIAFQHDHDLAEDGMMNQDDFDALRSALADESDEPDSGGEHEDKPTTDGSIMVTGNTVYVRAAPSTSGAIMGIVRKGSAYPYAGETLGTWHSIIFDGADAWISGKYTALSENAPSEGPEEANCDTDIADYAGRKIVDLSKWNGKIKDGKALAGDVSFVIHRASCGENKDQALDANAAILKKHKVPFGVYHYLKALTVADARAEARVFYASAAAHMPVFWALDCEYAKISTKTKKESGFARRITDAFRNELIELGIGKDRIGVYIGHHLYKSWNLDYDSYAFSWIPRYGTNDGSPQKKPDYPYTLWQYTSRGRAEGISDKTLDLNLLNPDGVKRLQWFMGRE